MVKAVALINRLKSLCGLEKHEKNVLYFRSPRENFFETGQILRDLDFRLLTVSAIDWLKKNRLDVYFLVHDLKDNLYVKVTAEIPRDDPRIESLSSLWVNAAMHEREAWRLFGVVFEGNNMLKPLFLEGWTKPLPFRKDFNWIEYVEEKYGLKKCPEG